MCFGDLSLDNVFLSGAERPRVLRCVCHGFQHLAILNTEVYHTSQTQTLLNPKSSMCYPPRVILRGEQREHRLDELFDESHCCKIDSLEDVLSQVEPSHTDGCWLVRTTESNKAFCCCFTRNACPSEVGSYCVNCQPPDSWRA